MSLHELRELCDTHPVGSMYLPGKVGGKPMQFLLDTGCTTSVLSKTLFERLPPALKQQLDCVVSQGVMADGSTLPIYGSLPVTGRIRSMEFTETFLVGRIKDDAILGMSFFSKNRCSIDFKEPSLILEGRALPCTDRIGNPLMSKVQILNEVSLAPGEEVAVLARLCNNMPGKIGIVESRVEESSGILVAASLNEPRSDQLLVRCCNFKSTAVTLKKGKVIANFQAVSESDVQSLCNPSVTVNRMETSDITDTTLHVPDHVKELYSNALGVCSTEQQRQAVGQLLTQYADVFSSSEQDIGRTTLVTHEIPVVPGVTPIHQPPRRLGFQKEAEVERQLKKLEEQGLIEPGDSAWASPVVLVRKRDNTWRFCVDYRRLNSVTIKDAYPIPHINDSLDALAGSRYYSTLDLLSGYWQVPLGADAQNKAAFITRGGLWKWKVLPFGLTSAPATFERLMETVLRGLHWKSLLVYLDDVIVFSTNIQEHCDRLASVLERLRAAGLKLKPSKCELFRSEVKYLGHVVSSEGVATDPAKVEAIANWAQPGCDTELKAFLGTVGYYRRFVPDFATIAKPLNQLCGKLTPYLWTEECEDAFQKLKAAMTKSPVLNYPDPALPFILDTDASQWGVGAVLSQERDGERVVAYFSKAHSPPEKNYCVTRKELLAVIKAVKHFRPYLYGRKFQLRTDHASLIWLTKLKQPSDQVARWLELLSEYDFTIHHRPGAKHQNADGMSRQVCEGCKQCQRIERRDGVVESLPLMVAQLTDETPEIVKLQQTVGDVSKIYGLVQRNETLTAESLKLESWELGRLHRMLDVLLIRPDGILEVRLHQGRPRWVVVCPQPLRQTLIWEAHQQIHSGIDKTRKLLALKWFWPGMSAEVRRVVRTCETCQLAKHSTTPTSNHRLRLYAGRPWQRVAVDLVGPMPETDRTNKWILVISDHFTRWMDGIALPDATTPVIAHALEERVFAYFGLPECIHSDRGSQFESELMAELCKLWGVDKTRTTPYHPQANGVVERNNRTIGDSLRCLLMSRGQTDWDLVLPHIMRQLRAVPHSATQETPNFLLLGREVRLPGQLLHEVASTQSTPVSEYALQLQSTLREAHEILRDLQVKVRCEDTEEPPLFKPGDTVLMRSKRKKKGVSRKLASKFVGPYIVTQAFDNHTYRLKRNGQESTEHEMRLKHHVPAVSTHGQAPVILEPTRRPNMKGRPRGPRTRPENNQREIFPTPASDDAPVNTTAEREGDGEGRQNDANCVPPLERLNDKPATTPVVTRSSRVVKAPPHFNDFVL